MLHNHAEIKQLKNILSPIDKKHQGIAATIGLLAFSGLNHTEQMPEMCHLFKKIFNLNSCGFFWSDQSGNMQDAWCLTPEFLSFGILMSCLEFQASGNRTWPSFQENVLIGPTAGYLLPFQNEHFYASQHFKDTYQTVNVRHILDVVLHDGKRPFGAFLLMRNAQQGPFTPDERSFMVKLIPILNKIFSTPSTSVAKYSEKELTGFALAGKNGKCKSMSEEARRIIWTLSHIQPGSFADPNDPSIEHHLERVIAKNAMQLELGEKISIKIDNRWGRFSLAFEQEPKTRDTILILRRKIPFMAQLAYAISKLNLSPMRQMVAWHLAQNKSRNEIAAEMELSVETITSHIKQIYNMTGTSSSHGLMLKLTS